MLAPFLLWDGLRHHLENSLLGGIFINNTKFSSFQAAHLQRLVLRSLAHPAANIILITLEVEIGNRYSDQCYSFSSSLQPMSILAQAPIYFYFLPLLPPLYLTPCISSDPQIAFISQKLGFPSCRWKNKGRGITRCLQRAGGISLKFRRPAWASAASAPPCSEPQGALPSTSGWRLILSQDHKSLRQPLRPDWAPELEEEP